MNTHLLALQLMAAQGCLGAFDTLYHHELTEALPSRASARRELAIHAVRALIYSALFIGLAFYAFHGLWAAVLLAMNGGAFVVLLALNTPAWLGQPTALVWQPHGLLSVFLALCGIGVGLSGVRDALAARKLAAREEAPVPVHFGDAPQDVLVTGATGFIGQRLVGALLADSHRVIVLTRQVKAAAWMFNGRAECIASMDELPTSRRIDVVINLAGARILGWRWTAARREQLRRSRIALTARVVDWIARAEHKPELMLSASAIGYYGVQPRGDDRELNEEAPPQAIFMSDLCREWEEAALRAEGLGVKVARMRFGLVLGHGGALPMMLLPVKLGLGGPLGDGRQWLSWIHVIDLIGAIGHLMRTRAEGAFNFTAPECLPQAQFNRIAAKVERRPFGMPTPALPMRLLLGEQADLLLEGQRVVPERLLATGFTFRYPALEPALRSLSGSHNG